MRVLIIPEDPTLDQHILKPIVTRIFDDLEQRARVDVLTDPHIRGIDQALDSRVVQEVIEDNPMIDLFILMVDRDCDRVRNTGRVKQRIDEHAEVLRGVLAVEEVEVWALAVHRSELDSGWSEIRDECDPKERFWDPFVANKGWYDTVGKGRKRAMRELGRNWTGIVNVCPELATLKGELSDWLEEWRG